ncbi:MAG: hypothetical protein A2277_05475 [Desulfobacterales bacterium RIFOXYA12_FULL_46_15]|nr:MAG: hypothetical protein A2097_06995 [Desulfobacula sp. GWF2_41_7]OGR23179.1 MAG: hypothetical protein A2277_05475 [Desulfobacterales bacterium RIFOXYA12_FULL_46_15]
MHFSCSVVSPYVGDFINNKQNVEAAYSKIRTLEQPILKKIYDISSNELARKLKVSPGLISRLINGKTDIRPAMALTLPFSA